MERGFDTRVFLRGKEVYMSFFRGSASGFSCINWFIICTIDTKDLLLLNICLISMMHNDYICYSPSIGNWESSSLNFFSYNYLRRPGGWFVSLQPFGCLANISVCIRICATGGLDWRNAKRLPFQGFKVLAISMPPAPTCVLESSLVAPVHLHQEIS